MAGKRFKINAASTKGFSLLEVMIALGILSVGVLAMATALSTSRRILAEGDQSTRAAYLAQNKMEALRAQRPVPIRDAIEGNVEGMSRKWSIVQDKDHPRLWVITVEVFPPNRPDQSYVLRSLSFY